jgi:hypothetical protein
MANSRRGKEVHVKRWNRIVAALLSLVLIAGARGAVAQPDPASPDQGGAASVGAETWYTQPWVWIVLGVALVIVLLALGTKRGDRTRT